MLGVHQRESASSSAAATRNSFVETKLEEEEEEEEDCQPTRLYRCARVVRTLVKTECSSCLGNLK